MIQNKTVLDVGCGTGILSLFAAKAGARKVVGVDLSSMAEIAQQNIKNNHLSDKIKIFQGKIENFDEFDFDGEKMDQFDIIVSEWMGYALVYEGMLESVIVARDRFLKPGGILLPDQASLYIAGFDSLPYRIKHNQEFFWQNQYGFDLSAMTKVYQNKPILGETLDSIKICSNSVSLFTLNLKTVTKCDLKQKVFNSFNFNLYLRRNRRTEKDLLSKNKHKLKFSAFQNLISDDEKSKNLSEPVDLEKSEDTVVHRSGVSSVKKNKLTEGIQPLAVRTEKLELEQEGRKSTFSGFVMYFDVGFHSNYDERIQLTTKHLTHWHHSIFPFPKIQNIDFGDYIQGKLVLSKKEDCQRNLVFNFEYDFYKNLSSESVQHETKQFIMS